MATSISKDIAGMEERPAIPSSPVGLLPAAADVRYVARQPILNGAGRVHGYELLFRSGPEAVAFSGDGNAATRTVLDNSVVFGLERLTGGLPMFINCTAEALLERLVLVLPPEHTVLELLETLRPTPELVEACKYLKERGYRLALDDFEGHPGWEPLVRMADYVKVDLSSTTALERKALVRRLRGMPAKLVLERVETPADVELGRKEGFTLFQGYYFCRPVLIQNRAIPANRLVQLEMLQALLEEPLDVKRVGELVKHDASLTYRLLRMVNSPLYATRAVVSSIHGALVLIGDEMFRRVATLAIASELSGKIPSELLQMAFLRARFCEMAAPLLEQDPMEQYLMGILSLMPALMSVPMENIAKAMPLRGEVRQALNGERNLARIVLTWLEFYEQAEWASCDRLAAEYGFSAASLPRIYADALEWAEKTFSLAIESGF